MIVNNTPAPKSESLPHTKYRADIDGLRAVAVLIVVTYHAFPSLMKGGFIGVDIFFVISGFLISTIIFGNLERNKFSFVEFYSRRIKRIFPALLVVLIACIAFGWFVLNSNEYKLLGKHVMGGAGFISNILFWRESNYFDVAAETKILLHLWSLGVEEQYYIIWPLLLWLGWKYRTNLLAITTVLLIASFALNINTVQIDPTASFYSPFTRFWEMLVGSALAYITLHPTVFQKVTRMLNPHQTDSNSAILRNLQSLLGATLIVAGLIFITRETSFPGWWAVLPTFGAMLIISAGTQAWLNRTVLSNQILVWFGLISYPLYLWHWPLLVFANIMEVETLSPITIIAVVLLSILLAWLTYSLIEKPVRLGNSGSKTVPALVFVMLFVGISGYTIFSTDGFQGYGYRALEKSEFESYFENSIPKWNYFEKIGLMSAYRYDCDFYDIQKHRSGNGTMTPLPISSIDKSCYTKDPSKEKVVLLWGDSHAQQLYYGLSKNLPGNWQILVNASSACIPNPYVQEDSEIDFCQRSNWFAIQTVKNTKPDVVIVAQESGFTIEKINAVSDILFENGAGKVIIAGPAPQWNESLPNIILRDLWEDTPERTLIGVNENIMNENSYLKSQFPKRDNLVFVDIQSAFCNKNGCLTRVGSNKQTDITTWDIAHLTPAASNYLAKKLLVDVVTGR